LKIYLINMAKIKGNDLILFIRKEEEYKALAYSTTCEIDIQADTIEVGSPDTGQWTKKKKKRKNWRASSGYLISDSVDAIDVFKTLVGNESISLMIGTVEPHALSVSADEYVTDERLTIKGDGMITRMTITGKRGDFVTMSIDIEGSGALDIKIKEWIIISPESIQASPLTSFYKVEVKSNTRWSFTVVEGSDFISYEGKNQGKGNGDAVFKIGTNVSGQTRTGVVQFITENKEGVMLKINQESVTPSVTIDQDTLSVIRQGGDYTIHVSANTDWQIDYHPSWVTLSQESGGAGEFDITVTVSPNITSESREDDIGFVTVVEGGEGANCVVTQTAEGDYLVLSPDNVTIDKDGNDVYVGVQSNYQVMNLTLRPSESWLMAMEGNDTEITVYASANTGEKRTGTINVSTPSGITEIISAEQEGEISSTPYVRPTSNYVFFNTNNEGSQLLELDTNVDIADILVQSLAAGWVTCSLQKSDGKIYIKIDVLYSSEEDPRAGLIALQLADEATEGHIITVGQMGAYNNVVTYSTLIYIGPTPTIVPENDIPRSYTQMRYYVICDSSWVVTDQASFTQMDVSAGGTDGEATMTEVYLTVNANESNMDRVGDIVMVDSYSTEVAMSLTQKSTGSWIGLSGGNFRPITNEKQHVTIICPSNLSEAQIADVSYEILDNGGDWIGFTNNNITGSQFSYIFTVQANATGATRLARILIKYTDINPIVITISQQA
jgi:predicted secreted protein